MTQIAEDNHYIIHRDTEHITVEDRATSNPPLVVHVDNVERLLKSIAKVHNEGLVIASFSGWNEE